MKTATTGISLPLSFMQVRHLVKQLPYEEKKKLAEVIRKDMKQEDDAVFTHVASESSLAKEWLSAEEDEAWNDL